MTDTITIMPNMTATLIVEAGEGPTLINNPGPNTVFLGDNNSIRPGDANGIIALNANGYINVDGRQDLYATINAGSQTLTKLSGGLNFFSPPSLSGLGGASVFVQALAPTGVIAPNSLWFNTTTGAMEVYIGGVWTVQQFNGQQLIQATSILAGQIGNATLTTAQIAAAAGILGSQIAASTITGANIAANTITASNIAANTITAAQLAAGIVYAGIVDATEIVGAIFRAKNSFGATIMTINKTNSSWIQYLDTGSAAQGAPIASSSNANFTDEFSNALLAGTVTYVNISGTIYAVQQYQGNINFVSAASFAGPWNAYSSLQPNTLNGLMNYYDNIGTSYNIGHRENSGNSNQLISLTTPTDITGSFVNGLAATSYHGIWEIFYVGNQAAGTALFNLTLEGGAVCVFNFTEFVFITSNSLTERLNTTVGTFNNPYAGPTLVGGGAVQRCRIEAWFTLSNGGNVGVAAREGTAGDTFFIAFVAARMEKRQ